jgi:hypothetical protein
MSGVHAVLRRVAPTVPARPPVQAKLRIGAASDPLEHEADRAADAVMRGEAAGTLSAAAAATPQRLCAGCEAEEQEEAPVQRKCASCAGSAGPHASGESAAQAVETGGAPLSPDLRAYFEPRFGRDLSPVRLHTGGDASAAARAIDARAYTLGSNIAFATGEYQPASPRGRHLLAHELAHVAQQGNARPQTVRRAVAGSSTCPAHPQGAGPTALADLTTADARAELITLGTSLVLVAEAITFANPTFGPSDISRAFERRFGLPAAGRRGRFPNRFSGASFATRNEAIASEMQTLSARFARLHRGLIRGIRYRCPGTSLFTLPGCAAVRCDANDNARACPGGRQIALCNAFWTAADMQGVDPRAATIIHEAVHVFLGVFAHSITATGRLRNPECFAAFIADIYGFAHNDQADCVGLIP